MIKIIRREWLPTNLPDLAAWFANFALKFAEVHTSLGFVAADNTAVQNASNTVQWLSASMETGEANMAALRSFRDQTLYGGKNDEVPAIPSMDMPTKPDQRASSIVQWLDNLREKIVLADNYTPDIGAQLGIVVPPSESISEVSVKPSLQVFPANEGYDFAVVVNDRAKADQSDLQLRAMNQEKWESLLRFTGKSTDAQYKPTPEGEPVKIELRVQLYRKNEKYGSPSDAVYVTLNP